MDLYSENILHHYKNPSHYGVMEDATAFSSKANAACGDKFEVFLKISSAGVIKDASFAGDGCAISKASCSMLMEKIIGMRATEVLKISDEEVCENVGVNLASARAKCATLSIKALKEAVNGIE